MLTLGMPTLLETPSIEECAALCASLGLNFIELNMNLPQYQTGQIDVAHFTALAHQYGIFYTIHLDENTNVCDFNPLIADGYMRTVENTIALAKRLSVPVINMHLANGVYFTLPDSDKKGKRGGKVYLFSEYKERYLARMVEFRKRCEMLCADGSGADVKICIENCDGYKDFQIEALNILLASPVFGLTFDIGHNRGADNADEAWILWHKERLYHMHMHDAVGKRNHLALGQGEFCMHTDSGGMLPIERYLTLAKEQRCRIVLETKTVEGLTQSVDYLRQHWI